MEKLVKESFHVLLPLSWEQGIFLMSIELPGMGALSMFPVFSSTAVSVFTENAQVSLTAGEPTDSWAHL